MNLILRFFSFLLIFVGLSQAYAEVPAECRGVNLSQFMHTGVPTDAPPEQIYRFTVLKNQTLQSIRQQRGTALCYAKFYRSAMTEQGDYWGRKLAQEGCVVNENGNISGTCPSASEARRSVQFMTNLDRDMQADIRATHEASEALEDAAGEAAGAGSPAACAVRSTATAGPEQVRENLCCGAAAARATGAIGALEPGITRNLCLSKIRPTNRRILSASSAGQCLAGIARSALTTFINNLGSIISLPGQLWAARSQIWSLMTSSAARARFVQQISQIVQQFVADRINAVTRCYNRYEIAQYSCRVAGQIVGNFFTGGAIGTVLKLAAGPAAAALRGLSAMMQRTSGAGKLARAAQIIRTGGSAIVRTAVAADRRTGRVVSRSATVATNASRILARPLTGTIRVASNFIARAPAYRSLLLRAYRFERRQVQATRDFRRLADGADDIGGPRGGGGGGAAAAAAADGSPNGGTPEIEILPPERPVAAAQPPRPGLNQTIDMEQGPDGVYRAVDPNSTRGGAADVNVETGGAAVRNTGTGGNSVTPVAPGNGGNSLPAVRAADGGAGDSLQSFAQSARRVDSPGAPNAVAQPNAALLPNTASNVRALPAPSRVTPSAVTPDVTPNVPQAATPSVGTAAVRTTPTTNNNVGAALPDANAGTSLAATNARVAGIQGGSPTGPANVFSGGGTSSGRALTVDSGSGGGSIVSNRVGSPDAGQRLNSGSINNVGRNNAVNSSSGSDGGTTGSPQPNTKTAVARNAIDNNTNSATSAGPDRAGGNAVEPAPQRRLAGESNRPLLLEDKTPQKNAPLLTGDTYRPLATGDRTRLDGLDMPGLRGDGIKIRRGARYEENEVGERSRELVSESRITRVEIENRLARLDTETREKVLAHLESVTDPDIRTNHFAAILNSKNELATISRLRLTSGRNPELGRRAALRKLDTEINERTRRISDPNTSADDLAKATQERSALLIERVIVDLGDKIKVRNIVSANTHNRFLTIEKGREGHSLGNTFNMDVEITGKGVRVTRGSYGTEDAYSGPTGGFYTLERKAGYLDRGVNTNVLAAPSNVNLPDIEQGASRYWSLDAEGKQFTLGQNGPVRYKDGAIAGSGGEGGSIEFFCSRSPKCPGLDDVAESVRIPTCRRGMPNCDRIFGIQENVRFGDVLSDPKPALRLSENRAKIQSVLRDVEPDHNRLADELAQPDADISAVRAKYPEVVSAIKVDRQIELQQLRLAGRTPAARRYDLETAETIEIERQSTTGFNESLDARLPRAKAEPPPASLTEAQRAARFERINKAFNETLDTTPALDKLRRVDTDIANTRAKLGATTDPAERRKLAADIIKLSERRSDYLMGYGRIRDNVSSRIKSKDLDLSPAERAKLTASTNERIKALRTPYESDIRRPQAAATVRSTEAPAPVRPTGETPSFDNDLELLANRDGLSTTRITDGQIANHAQDLRITDKNMARALDYKPIATRADMQQVIQTALPDVKIDTERLRRTLSFKPQSGYLNRGDLIETQKFVQAVQSRGGARAFESLPLNKAQRETLNRVLDRAPMYARQVDAATPSRLGRVSTDAQVDVDPQVAARQQIAADLDAKAERARAALNRNANAQPVAETAPSYENDLQLLANRDGLATTRITDGQMANYAQDLRITDKNMASALDYKPVATRADMQQVIQTALPDVKIDTERLRRTLSFSPQSGYLTRGDLIETQKFVQAVQARGGAQALESLPLGKAQRETLNRVLDRAPMYARQIDAATPNRLGRVSTDARVDVDPQVAVRQQIAADLDVKAERARAALNRNAEVQPVKEKAPSYANEIEILAERDRLTLRNASDKQIENHATDLRITNPNMRAALEYQPITTRLNMQNIVSKVVPEGIRVNPETLRRMMSFRPQSGYLNGADFAEAKKFMQAIEARGGVQGLERLSLSKYEMDTLNQLVDRVPMYARQLDPALPASLRPSRGLSNAEGSGARVTPAVEAPSPAVDPSLTRLSAKDYGRPVFTQKATIYQNGRETNVSPIRYDVEMAASAKLDVSEVMALRRNFDSTVPETGETGLFRVGDDVVIDPNTNIVAAYKSFTQRLESGTPLTGQDFIDVRKQAYSVRAANGGEGRTEIPFQFKNKYTATIPAEIPPYVRERLSHYGIEHRIENGQTKIIYPDAARGPPLDRLADDVNRMIAEGQPPERVTAFMAQDLLILHPFKDGNGRTARLMAQGMYRKMTGRDVVFPEQFKREMEYSVDDLARSILPPRTGVSVTSRGQNIPLRDIEMEAWRNGGSWPRTARLDEVQSPAPRNDVAFPNEIKNGRRSLVYRDLPLEVRTNNNTLYYGRAGGDTLASAEREALSVMRVGRGSRGGSPTYNIAEHVGSPSMATRKARGAPTGFFPTSENFETARAFGSSTANRSGKPGFAVVYAIDGRGADVLNIHKMPDAPTLNHVVFAERLNPSRVQAAIIIDTKTSRPVAVIRNPEYYPRSPADGARSPAAEIQAQRFIADFEKNGLNEGAATRLKDDERVAVAQAVVGRNTPLTPAQIKALNDAHNIDCGGFSVNNPCNANKGILLRRAGYTPEQTRRIMQMGVAGKKPDVAVRSSSASVRRSPEVTEHSGDFAVVKSSPGVTREGVVRAFREKYPNAKPTRIVVDVPIAPRAGKEGSFIALNPAETASVNAWAEDVLAAAQAANPGRKLKIQNIAAGFDWNVGGSYIHADNAGTYLHATSTLKGGPSTIMFTEAGASRIRALEKAMEEKIGDRVFPGIKSINPDGSMTIVARKGSQEYDTITLPREEYLRPDPETTAFFSGADHAKVTPGRRAAYHASPPSEGGGEWDRVTFFANITEDVDDVAVATARAVDNVTPTSAVARATDKTATTPVADRTVASNSANAPVRVLPEAERNAGRQQLIESYGSRVVTTPDQNSTLMKMRDSSNPNQRDRAFLYDDNTQLGEINNVTNNKLLANAITNRRLVMVNEAMADLARNYTKVPITHVPYTGFKLGVHGFKTNAPNVELPEEFLDLARARMAKLNTQYSREMRELNLLPSNVNPEFIFRSGLNRNYTLAEQGARYARTAPDTNYPRDMDDSVMRDPAEVSLQWTQLAQRIHASKFKGTDLVVRDAQSGNWVFTPKGMDLIKKAKTPDKLIEQVRVTTGIEINERQANLLIKHKADNDQPIPTTLVTERQSPVLDSIHGGVNFDLVGAGAEGSYQSQLAFARSKNLDELFENQAAGERKVTELLNQRRARVRAATEPIMTKYGVQGRFVESGDDMAFIPSNKPIPQKALDEIVQNLGRSDEPSKVRMSAVGGGIDDIETRMNIGTQGEAIEKEVRQQLIGVIPDKTLDNVLFAVQMQTRTAGQGQVRLITGAGVKLTAEQQRLIQNAFSTAARKYNYTPQGAGRARSTASEARP